MAAAEVKNAASIVTQRPENQGYQSIGGLVLPTDLDTGQITGAPVATNARRGARDDGTQSQAPAPSVAAPVERPASAAPQASEKPLTGPGEIVKAARARVKQIRAELKKHTALKKELAELERLIAAAKAKPAPKVRSLKAAG